MYNKLNKTIKCFAALMFVTVLVVCADVVTAFAAANIDITADNAAAEQEVKVKVTVNADQNIGTFDLRITYDPTLLDYVSGADNGGSGVLQVLNSELTQSNTVTKEITFRALGEGTAAVTVQAASSNVLDMNANPMEIAGGQGNIVIGNSPEGSADNSLSSINVSAVKKDGTNVEVSLTPAFSKDVTDYSLNVGNDTKKLSVAVTSSDPAASTKITGTKLQEGDNMTVITVTASNGETKEYKIYTKKGDDASSEQPSQAVASNIEALPLPEDLSTKKDGKTGKFIVQNFDGVAMPEGFTPQGYQYGEGQVAVAGNGSVVAFYLADDEAGANAAWFVYNKDKDTFSLYNVLECGDKKYVLLSADNSVNIPEGFSETTIKINDIDATIWSNGNDAGVVIIYASCNGSQPALYYYDNRENTAIRYFAIGSNGQGGSDGYKSKYLKLKSSSDDNNIVIIEIIVGFSIICIILGVMCIVFARKAKNGGFDNEDDEDDEEVEDTTPDSGEKKELKLDMAMQANEVKTETLANDVNSIMEEDGLVDTMNMMPQGMDNTVNEPVPEQTNVNIANEVLNGENVENDVKEDKAADTQEDNADIDIVFVDLEENSKS